jgi:hypothetical protein
MSRESVTAEINEWAERCRLWATGARTREQRIMLHSLEMVLSRAAMEAEPKLDINGFPGPFAPTQS